MKVKASLETIQRLIELLETYDASTEQFLDGIPTPEKYAILCMALVVKGTYEDFEIAYDEMTHKVSAQQLTKHMIDFKDLRWHLQDALRLKWSYFEVMWTNGEDEDEEEN